MKTAISLPTGSGTIMLLTSGSDVDKRLCVTGSFAKKRSKKVRAINRSGLLDEGQLFCHILRTHAGVQVSKTPQINLCLYLHLQIFSINSQELPEPR